MYKNAAVDYFSNGADGMWWDAKPEPVRTLTERSEARLEKLRRCLKEHASHEAKMAEFKEKMSELKKKGMYRVVDPVQTNSYKHKFNFENEINFSNMLLNKGTDRY